MSLFPHKKMIQKRRGFTLIELLVVVSIISLLSSVVLASLNEARYKARIGAGKQFYSSTHHAIGDRLVGEWKFENVGSLIADDTSGYGFTGALLGGASQESASVCDLGLGGCLDTNGLGGYVDAGDILYASALGTFTMCAWANSAVADGVVHTVAGKEQHYHLTTTAANEWQWRVWDDTATTWIKLSGSQIEVNKWIHLCGSWDGTNQILYENGRQANSDVPVIGSLSVDMGYEFQIGKKDTPAHRYFDGLIDEVRVYSSVLSAQEVGRIYAEGKARHMLAGVDATE
jgi:prepilin-type N-terminal cleavage/methylation domain-containing protein